MFAQLMDEQIQLGCLMLSFVGQEIKSLKEKDFGNQVTIMYLDLSANQLSIGKQFSLFPNILTLIIDDNLFSTLHDFPIFKSLETFSANKNNFADLTQFLNDAHDRFGNLRNLSLLKNPLNPFFEGEVKYHIYRDHILQKFPTIKTIDGCAVTIMKKQIVVKKKQQEAKYEQLGGYAVFDEKYASDQVKSVKGRSEGNRFLKNDQL